MANFSASFDINKIFPKGITDENLAIDMIKAGQKIMKSAIQSGANRHKKTGSMANSVKSTSPKINKNGDLIGKVQITGKDKNRMSNAQKSLWLEYGTKNFSAVPFVRPAIKSSESQITSAMNSVFNEKVRS